MPMLDAGIMAANMLNAAEAAGMSATFCNPAIRDRHKLYFEAEYSHNVFCGAVALGWPMEPDWVQDTP